MKLKEVLNLYLFRDYRSGLKTERKRYDTNIIRIYLDEFDDDKYVEFGIYDYSEDEYKKQIYEEFIKKETLERKIYRMYFDYELNTFCIELEGTI